MTLAKATASRMSAPEGTDEAEDQATPMAIIQALGGVLTAERSDAMSWRTQSGIEQDWAEDEEFYDARDRANPEGESNVGKPVAPNGGAENRPNGVAGRSSVFIPITRAYVDGAAARVADMLLPNDDAPWKIIATPIPDAAVAEGGGLTPIASAAAGVAGTGPMPAIPQGLPGMMPPQGGAPVPGPTSPAPAAMGGDPGMAAPPAAGQMPAGVTSQVMNALPDEEKRAERANKVIEDWLIECQWHAETRKAIEDAAMIGTGILKGPFPVLRKSVAYVRDPATGQYGLKEVTRIVPITKRIHPRNFWTDKAGGENHQAGSYTWELDNISARELRKLLNDETYIQENILRALREGPGAKSGDVDASAASALGIDLGGTFPMWYRCGDIDKGTMIAAGVPDEMLPEGEENAVAIPAMIVMVNDHVIKVTPMPLETGGFPYDMFPWQRRPGIPWGKGVARQIRTPQRMLNAAVRAMMDNGGLTSGPMYAIRKGWVVAIDGDNSTLTPRKGFYITSDAPPNAKLEDCISWANITSNVNELNLVIDRAMRFAEDATGLPMLMQGQQGEATTTATGMTILNNNGSTVLRRIARTFDDYVTEPHIRRYYYWLMANQGNDEAKGDFQIDARGSTYLVDRDLQAQNLNVLFPMFAQHPDVHPGRLAEEVAMANRLNYKRIMLTDAEKKARDEQPPPKPESVQVAEIREQGATARAEMQLQQKDKNDVRLAQVKEGELQAKVELGLGKLAADMGISTDSIKAMLAVAAMREQANRISASEQRQFDSDERGRDRQHERTRDIEGREAASDKPPGEPPHRAPAGAAYAQ